VHNELRLISKVIETGDVRPLIRSRMTPSLFRNPEARAMFEELWRYYHNQRHYGETPKRGWMESKFQSFTLFPGIDESVTELVEYVRRDTLAQRIYEVLTSTYEHIHTDPHEALNLLYQQAGELKSISAHKGSNFTLHEVTEEIWERYLEKERLRLSGGVSGIPWPWAPLNKVTGGLENEQLIVLYGPPKSMKTMFAVQLAVHAYLWNNQRVLLYSAEMPRKDMQDRMAACIAEVDYGRIDLGYLTVDEKARYKDALDFIRDEALANPSGRGPMLHYASDHEADVRGNVALIRSLAEELEADLVIVDSFYRLADRSGRVDLDWKVVGNVAQDLKALAKHLGIPVLGITQANEGKQLAFSKVISMETDLAMMVEMAYECSEYTDLNLTFTASRKIKQPGFQLRVQPYTRFSFQGWLEFKDAESNYEVDQGTKATNFGNKRAPRPKGPPPINNDAALIHDLVTRAH